MQFKIIDHFVLIYSPNHPRSTSGYVPEQIIVMEQHLGRELTDDEEVRHLNGNGHDNRIENLLLISGTRIHRPLTIWESHEAVNRVAKTFIPCSFQAACWKEIRAKIARREKIYLPYVCSFQTEGDIYKCSHWWNYREKQEKEKLGQKE